MVAATDNSSQSRGELKNEGGYVFPMTNETGTRYVNRRIFPLFLVPLLILELEVNENQTVRLETKILPVNFSSWIIVHQNYFKYFLDCT